MIPVPKLKPKSKRNSFLPRASQISEGADYRVPLISVSEIVGFCEQMDLALTEEDLVAPTRARIQLILEALVEILLPWRCDVMEQKLENALNSFDNIEIGEESTEAFIIYEEIKVFLELIRYSDFELTDILKPRPLRIQKMFSAIVNFALHRDSSWAYVRELSNDGNEMNKRKQELLESNQELEEILNKTRATNEAEAVEIDTYEQKNQEDEDKLRQLHKEADRVVKIGEAYKTERRGIKDTLQELNFLVLNVIEEVKAGALLQGLDYRVLVEEYDEMKTTLDSLTDELSLVSNSIPQVEQLLSSYKRIDKFLSKCIQLANSLATVKADMTRQQKTNAAIVHEIQAKDTTSVKKGQTRLSNLKVTAQVIESRKKNMLEQKKMTKERENESWKLLKEQEAACSKDIRALTEEKEECFEKIKQVNLQVNTLQYQNDMETKKLIIAIFERLCQNTIEFLYKTSEQEKR